MAAAAADLTSLSIIIPALNEAETIESLLIQLQPYRGRDHEIILVDGGSEDTTATLSQPLVDQVLHSPPGRAQQMHHGAQQASGSILWFLHADSCVPVRADERILHELNLAVAQWGHFDVSFMDNHPLLRCVAWFMNRRSRLTGIATGDQGIFVTRALYDTVGGFPQIPLMEDIRFSRALLQHTRPVCISSRLGTSPRRWQTHGILRTILTMWSLRLAHFMGVSPRRLAKLYPAASE